MFLDPMFVLYGDDEHSEGERRYTAVGMSQGDRLVRVSYTERGDSIRVISAREPETWEICDYEEGD